MSYSFTAANSRYLSTSSSPLSAIPMTIAAWFYSTSATLRQNICSPNTNNSAADNTLALLEFDAAAANDPLRATFRNSTEGSAASASSSAVSINTWNQGVAVFSAQNSRNVYLNRTASGSNSFNFANSTVDFDLVSIGGLLRDTAANFFSGQIAETAIWSAALTEDEIDSLAKGFKPTRIRPQSLVFYAPLVRDLQDLKGALTITNNNSATVADHPRVY
jgi:hypothetical protein